MDASRRLPASARLRAGLLLRLGAGVLALLPVTGCSGCKAVYAWDGGATGRPYYKVRLCPNAKPVVECDSPTRLPNQDCR